MRPLFLEMQAFGPFVEKQTVDFEKLSEKGIFLIKGKTGSGKTTIFDAMTFALYGGASGDADGSRKGRSDLEEWRCNQAPWEMETFVAFTFSVRGKKYRFARILEPKRSNLVLKYECGEVDGDGTVIPFYDNPKREFLNAKAEELIGLKKDQFRQVVLLPQGQFEKFLTASSDEKGEILEKIFDVENWKIYAEKFYETAYVRKEELDEIRNQIQYSLSVEGIDSLDELKERIESLRQEKHRLEKTHEEYNGKQKQKELNTDRDLSLKFQTLHELEKQRDDLLSQREDMDRKRIAYKEAEEAERFRQDLEIYEKSDADWVRRSRELKNCLEQIPEAERREKEAKEEKECLKKDVSPEEWKVTIHEYEQKRPVYASIDDLRKAYKDAEKKAELACSKAETAEKNCDRLFRTAVKCKDAFETAEKTAREYRNRYYGGIYGELAETLRDGERCPVCGSTNHPTPAKKTPDSVSKQAVDKKEEERNNAKELWDAAEKERHEAEQEKGRTQEESGRKKADLELARLNMENAEKNLLGNIPDTNCLEKEIDRLHDSIRKYEDEIKRLADVYTAARDNLQETRNRKESAEKEAEDAKKQRENARKTLEEELEEAGCFDIWEIKEKMLSLEQRCVLQKEIVEYETSEKETDRRIREQLEALSGKSEPDCTLLDSRQEEILQEERIFSDRNAKLENGIQHLDKQYKDLSERNRKYENEFAEAGNDLKFAKALRGDTGIGLQRYVLAVLFNQVIGEANRMLEKVHGGRYRLFRSDDSGTGARKKGLELKVYDSRSPDTDGRSVAMLSGGEKFLVSLALSIGMSTVAQRSGVQIEALFIDEGFGTLDDGSIQDAIDVLESIRRNSGMIGIISHVQLLESNIPMHLDVVKTDKGSYIRLD